MATNTSKTIMDPYKEANLDNAPLNDKVEDLVKFIDKCKFCMMATRVAGSQLIASRCMALAGKENNLIDLIFHANVESGKTSDLQADSDVNLAFLNAYGEWASISGQAKVVKDRSEVGKFYSEELKAWMGNLEDGVHDGGPEDPRICLIKVNTVTAQYSINRANIVGTAIEYAKGLANSRPPQINKLRHLDEAEIKQWRNITPHELE